MDIHARVQEFLQEHFPLLSQAGDYPECTKAGVVPFLRNPYRYYLMKPVAKNPAMPAPEFQLCKGTRMFRAADGSWQDMRDGLDGDIRETLAQTALREGIEELGLKLQNIKQLFDVGPYDFASATTGGRKKMWLFAAQMGAEDFSDDVAETTADRAWLTMLEFNVAGREDHRYILREIENKLKE